MDRIPMSRAAWWNAWLFLMAIMVGLLLAPMSARAVDPIFYVVSPIYNGATPEAACLAYKATTAYPAHCVYTGPPLRCVLAGSVPDLGPSCNMGIQTSIITSCPANSTLSGGSCVCNSGYVDEAGVCVPDDGCSPGNASTQSMFMGWDPGRSGTATVPSPYKLSTTGNACVSGCTASPTGVAQCYHYSGAPTKVYCDYQFSTTGDPCTGGDTPSTPDSSSPCPPGQVLGTVNDVPRCLAQGSIDPPPVPRSSGTSTNTVSNGDGTSTVTVTTTNPDGSTTVTTTVVNDGTGQPVSSSKVTTTAGPGKGTDGDTEQADYCRDNPNSPMCRQSSFAGTCGAFSCEGDGVQCAIAREQHQRNCEMFTHDEGKASAGQAIADGSATVDGDPRSAVEGTDLATKFNVSPRFGASCPDDLVVEISGASFTVPLSSTCPYLEWLGLLMVALTGIGCLGIAFGGQS